MRSSLHLSLAFALLAMLILPATGAGNPAGGDSGERSDEQHADRSGEQSTDRSDDGRMEQPDERSVGQLDAGRADQDHGRSAHGADTDDRADHDSGSYSPPPAPGTAGGTDPAPAPAAVSRVGRISLIEGEVSWFVESMASKRWVRAEANLPILSRSSLSTARTGRAEVRIGDITVLLHGDSQADFVEVDDESLVIRVSRGSVALSAPSFGPQGSITMRAADVTLVVRAAGSYVLGDLPETDDVAAGVIEGQADLRVGAATSPLIAGQQVRVGANGSLSYGHHDLLGKDLHRWVLERGAHWRLLASSQYVSPEVTGADVLQDFGQWEQEQSLGPIWYPTVVDASWAPYQQDGRWMSLEPWGRVWVGSAPWGFATSYYGRWHHVNYRWGWVPGTHPQGHVRGDGRGRARSPVFAPPPAGARPPPGGVRPPPSAFPPVVQPPPLFTQPPPIFTPAPGPYPTPPRNYPNPPRAYPTPPRDYPAPARRFPAPGRAAGVVSQVPSARFGPQTPPVFGSPAFGSPGVQPPAFVPPARPAAPRMVTKPQGRVAGTW